MTGDFWTSDSWSDEALERDWQQWCDLESHEARVAFCEGNIIVDPTNELGLQARLSQAVMHFGKTADLYAWCNATRDAFLNIGKTEWFKRRYPNSQR
jgi:hypothetical protein